mmetsp:Transcript_18645/g.56345  ORF Transcript_18645/g.56345 Transcript_18645/m.56345 type:complete len:209 (-) Transcript_18645:2268-2894(-)
MMPQLVCAALGTCCKATRPPLHVRLHSGHIGCPVPIGSCKDVVLQQHVLECGLPTGRTSVTCQQTGMCCRGAALEIGEHYAVELCCGGGLLRGMRPLLSSEEGRRDFHVRQAALFCQPTEVPALGRCRYESSGAMYVCESNSLGSNPSEIVEVGVLLQGATGSSGGLVGRLGVADQGPVDIRKEGVALDFLRARRAAQPRCRIPHQQR